MAGEAAGAVDRIAPGPLERSLRDRRDHGRKLLVPYLTGGIPGFEEMARAVAAAGADALEIGIPFSDPVMDGPTIQEASARALAAGATPLGVIGAFRGIDVGVPLVAMTYYNLVFRAGHARFASELADAGFAGAIVPDLNLEESVGWERDAAAAGIETVLLVAPVTPDDRLAQICARSRGFVYGVSVMGVTGERGAVAGSAGLMGKRLKAATDTPALVGFGVSTPEQAVQGAAEADGVIVGSALVRRVLDGQSPEEVAGFVADLRAALDAA